MLNKARQEVAQRKATIEQAVVELLMARSAGDKHEARVAKVHQELTDSFTKCETLEQGKRSKLPTYPL